MGKIASRSKQETVRKSSASKGVAMPKTIKPMLCSPVKQIPNNEDYIFEKKWDGYRITAYIKGGSVKLVSRGGLDYTTKYPLVVEALQKIKHDFILDGEMVVFDKNGRPSFNAVQNYNGARTPISYYVFDLIWMDGIDLKERPISDRKELLAALIPTRKSSVLTLSEVFTDGHKLYDEMLAQGMEGIVAKKKDSEYIEDNRSLLWLKIPIKRVDEFVIGGYAESDKQRHFRSLLFGAYEPDGRLKWVGRSGGGFKQSEMPAILKKLKALEIKSSPFYNKILDTKGAILHFVKPELVGLFEYSEMTGTGRIRKPATWKGFRYDKNPKQVQVPQLKHLPKAVSNNQDAMQIKAARQPSKKKSAAKHPKYLNADSNWKYVDEEAHKPRQTLDLEDCSIEIYDLDREVWKDQAVRKGELMLYYNQIAPYILPHLYNRPQSLNLKLPHVKTPTRFIKDMENRQPACASIFTDKRHTPKAGKRNQIDYLVCNNKETLLYMVNLGCVDINPWAARVEDIQYPTYIWIDIDPTIPEKIPEDEAIKLQDKAFPKVIEVATATSEVLKQYKLKGFVKTSGKTGMHVYIPCVGFDYKQVRAYADILARDIHQLLPRISTLEREKKDRANKIYIDATQNAYADTLAAPYSLRPYHGPIVSTPLSWREVKPGLDRWNFAMNAVVKRLEKKGDIFSDALDKEIAGSNSKLLTAIKQL